MVQTKVIGDKEGHIMALTSLTLNLTFEVISMSKWFFHMETTSFDPGLGKRGKFYVQNHIEKFSPVISRSNVGQTQKSPFKIVFSMNHRLSRFKLIVGLIEESTLPKPTHPKTKTYTF